MSAKRLAVLFLAAALSARAETKSVFYVHTGTSLPVSPAAFKDAYTQGYNVGLLGGLRLSPRFEVQAALQLYNCAFDVQGYRNALPELSAFKSKFPNEEPEVNIDGDGANIWTVFAHAKLVFPPRENGRVESYLYAGGGLFGVRRGRIEAFDTEDDDHAVFENHERNTAASSEIVPGLGFGIGLDVLLEEHSNFFVDLGPVIGFTKGGPTVVIPIRFGVSIRP
jgi:hypothetical protein